MHADLARKIDLPSNLFWKIVSTEMISLQPFFSRKMYEIHYFIAIWEEI